MQSIYGQYTQQLKTILSSSSQLKLNDFEVPELNINDISLTLKVKELDFNKIDEVLSPALREKLTDFRLKKDTKQVDDLIEKLWRPDEEKLQTFGWWQELLKDYIKNKFPNEYSDYEKILRELKVI